MGESDREKERERVEEGLSRSCLGEKEGEYESAGSYETLPSASLLSLPLSPSRSLPLSPSLPLTPPLSLYPTLSPSLYPCLCSPSDLPQFFV